MNFNYYETKITLSNGKVYYANIDESTYNCNLEIFTENGMEEEIEKELKENYIKEIEPLDGYSDYILSFIDDDFSSHILENYPANEIIENFNILYSLTNDLLVEFYYYMDNADLLTFEELKSDLDFFNSVFINRDIQTLEQYGSYLLNEILTNKSILEDFEAVTLKEFKLDKETFFNLFALDLNEFIWICDQYFTDIFFYENYGMIDTDFFYWNRIA